MKLHEYQAKDIFRKFNIPVPEGKPVLSADESESAAGIIKGPPWVVKAQVHAGGRGKGGGVRIAGSISEVREAVETILDKPLITKQTGQKGKKVYHLLLEEAVDIEREFYLAVTIDRTLGRIVMIFSQAGGMDIEEVAEKSPELVLKETIDPAVGWMPYQARNLVYGIEPLPSPETIKDLMAVMGHLYELFIAHDCSLVEINPLVITKNGRVLAVDAKMDIDDNSLFRQKAMTELDDPREKDSLEMKADKYNLNYIRLEGNM